MYFAVQTVDKKIISVPIQWFEDLELLKSLKSGISFRKKYTIFFAESECVDPVKNLPICNTFSTTNPARYVVKIKDMFKTKTECEEYCIRIRQQQRPPQCGIENIERNGSENVSPNDCSNAAAIPFNQKKPTTATRTVLEIVNTQNSSSMYTFFNKFFREIL